MIKKFITDNALDYNLDLIKIEENVEKILSQWLKEHSIHFLINSHEFNIDPNYTNIRQEENDTVEISKEEGFERPFINANLLPDFLEKGNE